MAAGESIERRRGGNEGMRVRWQSPAAAARSEREVGERHLTEMGRACGHVTCDLRCRHRAIISR